MKKAVLAIAVVLALAAGWFYTKKTHVRHFAAAEFVPGETIALAELPDWSSSKSRWRETALWKILHEPEVQAFLARPRSAIPSNAEWDETRPQLEQVKPTQAFLAVTEVVNNMPHAVAGFSFDGKPEAVEALIAKVLAKAQSASPAGKTESLDYGTFKIQSFSDKGVTLAGAFATNWYFVANDVELLKATLDRYSGKTQGSLSETEIYRKTVSHLSTNPDFLFFLQPNSLIEKLVALSATTGQSIDPQQLAEIRKIQAIATATRMEGERIHDTCFMLQPGGAKLPTLSKSTLNLTSPETLFYYAFAPQLSAKIAVPGPDVDVTGAFGGIRTLVEGLAAQGVTLENFKAAFGPEFALETDWPANSMQPTLGVAAEVKDSAAARKLMDAVGKTWPKEESAGVTYFAVPGSGSVNPAVALTEKHLIVGLSLDAVKSLVARAKAGGPTLEKSETFTGALVTVPKPGNALAYLDAKTVFERIYGTLRPLAMIWLNFVPHAGDYIDVSKLPAIETISKHLQPVILTSSQIDDGLLLESTGPITFYQAAFGLGTVGAAVAIPALQGRLPIPGWTPPKALRPHPPKAQSPAPAGTP